MGGGKICHHMTSTGHPDWSMQTVLVLIMHEVVVLFSTVHCCGKIRTKWRRLSNRYLSKFIEGRHYMKT